MLQQFQADAVLWVRGHFYRLYAHRLNGLKNAEICWTLHCDHLARFHDCTQGEIESFETSIGDHNVVRIAAESGIELQARDLATESRIASEMLVRRAVQRRMRSRSAKSA